MMTNERLEAEINSARRKDMLSNLLMSCAGVVLILTFVLKIYPLAILAVVLLLLGASLYSNSRSMTKKTTQRQCYKRCAEGDAGR